MAEGFLSRLIRRDFGEPLFPELAGLAVEPLDEIFTASGLERGVYHSRGMGRAPHPLLPPNLMASLRALIGVSAGVEIILFLADSPAAAKAAEVALATGYAPRVREALAVHGPALASAERLPRLDLRPESPWTELMQTLAERLPALMDSL